MEIYFSGVYNCKADAKGRVMLPVSLRNQMAPLLHDGFFIKKSYYDECLEFYPDAVWKAEIKKLNERLGDSRKDREFKRKFTAGLRRVEIDATGRLLIPKDIIGLVNITKEVTLSPMDNRLEIWDKATYDGEVDSAPESREELAYEVNYAEKPKDNVS
ncbi:division/cell wall cluster transcriptional repressor MraZ [Maribacter aestuarii]|uniref:division/cell wall cluster transcriptional repressor MraZ n=1 Tax=Maribacter aestuarii TaxID=1130723 RepID=UPI00248CAF74|nr:division/cell wall cluster transcriptional repressor MraZ [Maribacter aestuarii]